MKPISPKVPPDPPVPKASAAAVDIPVAARSVTRTSPESTPSKPEGSAGLVCPSPDTPFLASSNKASSFDVEPPSNLDFIAKIRPVGPVIGCTPHTSYAIKLGIARLTNEINTGSHRDCDDVLLAAASSVMKPFS